MTEAFLHYLFEYQFIKNDDFNIVSSGTKNADAGPDFFNAKIKIDNILWVGNVEIHVNASDWNLHGHQNDKAYDNIILHLVFNKDTEVKNSQGKTLNTIQIQFDEDIYQRYLKLIDTLDDVHCQTALNQVDNLVILQQIESLSVNRLERKSERFQALIDYNQSDIESAFYQALAIGFGGKVNAIPFELIAKETPLKVLLKNRHHLSSIEAILLGQAGILDAADNPEPAVQNLQEQYAFFRHKYHLTPIRYELLKYSKIRPLGFPDLKLAYWAQLVFRYSSLFQSFYECLNYQEVECLLSLQLSGFWDTHYRVNKLSGLVEKKMGTAAKRHLIINVIIPFMYAYTKNMGQDNKRLSYLEWLEDMKPENNAIIQTWKQLGVPCENTLHSQGLIELKKEMCEKHRCLDCKIGHHILTLSWN